MSRVRHIKPREAPPRDRPVLWFGKDGDPFICRGPDGPPPGACAWATCPTLTEPSGPVHSLEPVELPGDCVDVGIRLHGRWFEGFYDRHNHDASKGEWRVHRPDGSIERAYPDAWRPLPEDEPGDAELLEAARELLRVFGTRTPWSEQEDAAHALRALVEKRIGKDGGK